MSAEVVQLPMRKAPRAVLPHRMSGDAASAPAVRRLLAIRDAAAAREEHDAAVRAALQACSGALAAALTQLRASVTQRLDEVAALATELGLAVAREVVGDALARGQVEPMPIVRRCLEQAATGAEPAELRVTLSPADHALLAGQMAAGEAQWVGIKLLADAALARGVVKVDSGAGRLTYDPREVLERVSQELRKELAR